jgi:hypothetical protein
MLSKKPLKKLYKNSGKDNTRDNYDYIKFKSLVEAAVRRGGVELG